MRHDILHLKDFYDFLGADGADPVLEIYLPYNMPEMGRENHWVADLLSEKPRRWLCTFFRRVTMSLC